MIQFLLLYPCHLFSGGTMPEIATTSLALVLTCCGPLQYCIRTCSTVYVREASCIFNACKPFHRHSTTTFAGTPLSMANVGLTENIGFHFPREFNKIMGPINLPR